MADAHTALPSLTASAFAQSAAEARASAGVTLRGRALFLAGAVGLAVTLVGIGYVRVPWQLWICFGALGFFGALVDWPA